MKLNTVDWRGIVDCIITKSDMNGLCLCKQVSGVCATRKNVARIQDLLDDKCPNCLQSGKTAKHLNLCPSEGRGYNCSRITWRIWSVGWSRTIAQILNWPTGLQSIYSCKACQHLPSSSPCLHPCCRWQNIRTLLAGSFSWRAVSRNKYAYARISVAPPVRAV